MPSQERLKITKLSTSVLCLIILSLFLSSIQARESVNVNSPVVFSSLFLNDINNEINFSEIRGHVEILSSFQTRLTSYHGCEEAANYIESFLRNIGIKVMRHSYKVLVPVDYGANITIFPQQVTYNAYVLWPNDIQPCATPPEGIEGKLIYIGNGQLEDFDGLNITDSIVLMDFNSQNNWLNAAKLGAKAVIFIEPDDTVRTEAEQKFSLTPIYFPRLYITRSEGLKLIEMINHNQVSSVRIKSEMRWSFRDADNLIAVIPGREKPDEIIVVGAYYDSWSIVPKLSPGAEEAISPAVLLELAKLSKNHPPKRTVWLVFYSGHWQALSGARHFVESFFFRNETYRTGEKKILMQMGIQLSSESDTLAIAMAGDFYGQDLSSKPYGMDYIYNLIFRDWIPALSKELNYNFSYHIQDLQHMSVAKSEFFESEASSVAGILSFTLLTTNTLKSHVGTPFDTPDKISWTNLEPQITFIFRAIPGLINQNYEGTSVYRYWQPPQRRIWKGTGGFVGPGQAGFDNLIGRVEEYNLSVGFYQRVPNALVEVIRLNPRTNRFNPFTRMLTLADENGEFWIPGLLTDFLGGYYSVLAYVLDPHNGTIIYAPDFGIYGAGGGVYAGYNFINVQIDRDPMFVKTIVFRCKSTTLFDVINPLLIRKSRRAMHFYSTDVEIPPTSLTVNEFTSHSAPDSYGLISPYDTGESVAMIFLSPGTKFEVVLTTTTPENPSLPLAVGLLINASDLHPEGSGYSSDVSVISLTGFKFLSDLIRLNTLRAGKLIEYRMLTPSTREYYFSSRSYFKKALEALNNLQYSSAYNYLILAWNFEANAYREIRGSQQDLINTSILFSLLVVPFALILERIIFPTIGWKRFLKVILIMACFITVAAVLHPGFSLASNILASILGLSVTIISVLVASIILSNVSKYAKHIRSRILGTHFAEISRAEAFLSAVSTGISNLRKRPFRTFLNMVTVSIIVFSLVSFTSASVFTSIRGYRLGYEAPYQGMMLRQNFGMVPFSYEIIPFLSSSLGQKAIVAPRSWVYPPAPGEDSVYSGSWTGGLGSLGWQTVATSRAAIVFGPNGTKTYVKALLGLSPEESYVTKIQASLLPGSRWFIKEDTFVCILPKEVQSKLNAKIGDEISIMGIKLKVIGIVDENVLEGILDLDGATLAPIDPQRAPISGAQTFTPLTWNYVIIVPFNLAYYTFNGRINTIGIQTEDMDLAKKVLQELVMGTYQNLEIFISSDEGNVEVYRRGKQFTMERAQTIAIPTVIGGLTILTTLIGSIVERRKEIAVYSTVGLSPLHITGMFIAEAITYAIVGALFGYLSGLLSLRLLILFQLVPESMTVNFSSSFVLISVGFSMLLVILSSLWPAQRAGLMATPSLKRRWEITTKPIGDDWIIPLPFVSTTEEVDGILRYISEFLDIYTTRDAGFFFVRSREIRESVVDGKPCKELIADVSLAPWDSGLIQRVFIRAIQEKGKDWFLQIHLKYLQGDRKIWTTRNPRFIDLLRKQFLMWRGLKSKEKEKYIKGGE
ncbi:MAG TPA: FtsX-like permease family protein [Candidatus Bathyarchaeota archaeon]|nr:FtsX-like permease family protein [Candidatus Bathyarchaeota archaeon]